MPGVLILEAMVQVGAVAILTKPENKGKLVLFGGVKNARFKQKMIPGDLPPLLIPRGQSDYDGDFLYGEHPRSGEPNGCRICRVHVHFYAERSL